MDPAPRRTAPTWRQFLRSQAEAILACDFFTAELLDGGSCVFDLSEEVAIAVVSSVVVRERAGELGLLESYPGRPAPARRTHMWMF